MPPPGVIYVVTERLARAPLRLGEEVVIGNRRSFDIFTGELVSIDVVRRNGEVVTLKQGCGVALAAKE